VTENSEGKVEMAGKRRRMLDVCTLRYRACTEVEMINISVCLALASKNAMFRCDAEIQDWNVICCLCAKLPFFGVPVQSGSVRFESQHRNRFELC